MAYKLIKQIKDDEVLRNSFIELAKEIFGLSFEKWYEGGFWTEKYIPYVLTDKNKVVANASVNIINTVWHGVVKKFIQIGTVMTSPSYRNQGLAKQILNEILKDWKYNCDAVYLYANDTVLDFYPKFGFEKSEEHQYSMSVTAIDGDFKKLNMQETCSRELLRRCYMESNPYSALPFNGNYGLLMFYCADLMKECVYYSMKHDTICIASQETEQLLCYDIFGKPKVDLETLLAELITPRINKVILGFTPYSTYRYVCSLTDDDTIFVMSEKENLFKQNHVMMPLLSHA